MSCTHMKHGHKSEDLLYVIQHGTQQMYMVGKTNASMAETLSCVQLCNPIMLTVVCYAASSNVVQLQASVHYLLRKHCVRGEWFNCGMPDIYAAIGKASMNASELPNTK